MPLPDVAMLERAQTAGVASGVLVGDGAIVAAVVPVGGGRRRRFDVPDAGDVARRRRTCEGDRRPGPAVRRPRADFGRGHRRPAGGHGAAGRQGERTGARAIAEAAGWRCRRRWGRSCGSGSCIHPRRRRPRTACRCCSAVGGVVLGVVAFLLRRGRRRGARQPGLPAARRSGRPGGRVAADDRRRGRAQAARDAAVRAGRGDGPPADRDVRRAAPARCGAAPPGRGGIAAAPSSGRGVVSRARARRDGVEHVRALPAAGAAGRGRDGRALHRRLHGAEGFRRVFVVKRLRPQVARNRAAVEQFIDEAKLGSTLVHSNIVPVFDFGRSATSTSWRRSTSSGATSARLATATSSGRRAR